MVAVNSAVKVRESLRFCIAFRSVCPIERLVSGAGVIAHPETGRDFTPKAANYFWKKKGNSVGELKQTPSKLPFAHL
jgi:hypothetical protein